MCASGFFRSARQTKYQKTTLPASIRGHLEHHTDRSQTEHENDRKYSTGKAAANVGVFSLLHYCGGFSAVSPLSLSVSISGPKSLTNQSAPSRTASRTATPPYPMNASAGGFA